MDKIKIQKFMHYSFFLYVYETWSLTLREECGLWELEKRILRRIFGPKRGEVKGSRENYIMWS
jgi:hypothetical protein